MITIVIQFIKKKSVFLKRSLFILQIILGIISGIVGAGGAFIIIPIFLVLFKLSMNTVVTNSIIIAFISSIGAFVIKLVQGYIPLEDALFLVIGSVIFAPLGLKLGKKVPSFVQKLIISILIILAIIQIVYIVKTFSYSK